MNTLANQIESLVDSNGLYAVVLALEEICYGKAEHLASNWQAKQSAANWSRAGTKFDKLHTQLVKIQEISMSR